MDSCVRCRRSAILLGACARPRCGDPRARRRSGEPSPRARCLAAEPGADGDAAGGGGCCGDAAGFSFSCSALSRAFCSSSKRSACSSSVCSAVPVGAAASSGPVSDGGVCGCGGGGGSAGCGGGDAAFGGGGEGSRGEGGDLGAGFCGGGCCCAGGRVRAGGPAGLFGARWQVNVPLHAPRHWPECIEQWSADSAAPLRKNAAQSTPGVVRTATRPGEAGGFRLTSASQRHPGSAARSVWSRSARCLPRAPPPQRTPLPAVTIRAHAST